MDDLLPIGRFAKATRLSVKALRHYDELGLLRPAAVDSDSGYRFYHPDQLEQARLELGRDVVVAVPALVALGR